MAMIDELLFIKTFRERKAETALQRSRLVLVDAQRQEDNARQTLERFIEQATEDELRWYRELCARLVKQHDIEVVQQDVAIQRAEEQAHLRELEAAAAAHVSAQAAFNQATAVLRDASTSRSKFDELARLHHDAAAREAERVEELELEEVAGIVRERHDNVSHADV